MTRNKKEARRLAVDALTPLRSLPYEELVAEYLKRSDTAQVEGRDGLEYNIELTAHWDDRKMRTLRVVACVDDGYLRWGLFSTSVCDDFIIGPDGAFIGE